MGFIGSLLLAICIWFFYNLFVKLIWPVYKTTRHLRRQFRNMADENKQSTMPAEEKKTPKQPPVGEYIDFEEVK